MRGLFAFALLIAGLAMGGCGEKRTVLHVPQRERPQTVMTRPLPEDIVARVRGCVVERENPGFWGFVFGARPSLLVRVINDQRPAGPVAGLVEIRPTSDWLFGFDDQVGDLITLLFGKEDDFLGIEPRWISSTGIRLDPFDRDSDGGLGAPLPAPLVKD